MSSAGIGRALADWMIEGQAPEDLWEVDVARIDPLTAAESHLRARMMEAVADALALHWPFKQPKAGRGLRKSALHDRWAEEGAHFGLTAGWERGLWYAADESERELPYSVGEQAWQDIVHREAAVMAKGTALIDLSPFGKFDIRGPGALELLQFLAVSNLDTAIGRTVYTQLLNDRGGIEGDVTIARFGPDHFRMTSGAATRQKDLAWLRRHATVNDVQITDATETEVVVGVMGAGSRDLLASLSNDDWEQFPYSTARSATVAGQRCTATRMSFVGELGWELSLATVRGDIVLDELLAAGAKPLGHLAVDACRIEKGYKHWGHELGPDISPLEAGLEFNIVWKRISSAERALLKQEAEGVVRKLVLFELPTNPLVLHDEPIWENGRVVGLTTSGARAARTKLTLAFGLIEIRPDL